MATIREGNKQEMLGNPGGIAKKSRFDLKYKHWTTEQFGLITPFDVRSVITEDTHKLAVASQEQTYTMKAPLMSDVWKTKAWFQVPKMAILPNAWEKIYVQPSIGDDVDASIVGTSVENTVWNKLFAQLKYRITVAKNALGAIASAQEGTQFTRKNAADAIRDGIKYTIMLEYIYSYGSLINRLGCKLAALYKNSSAENFDTTFEKVISTLPKGLGVQWGTGTIYTVDNGLTKTTGNNKITVHEFLQKVRDNLNFKVVYLYYEAGNGMSITNDELTGTNLTKTSAVCNTLGLAVEKIIPSDITYSLPIDIIKLWSYQIVCAEFFTDDQIDYVYNADLYREYISTFVTDLAVSSSWSASQMTYTYNGISVPYDWMSAYYFEKMVDEWSTQYTAEDEITEGYFCALFNMNRSLKYKDYFVGAKTQPLLNGDTEVAVVNNKFDIVDVSKKTMATKFYFAVKRIGRKIEEYAKGLFGAKMSVDYHNPLWIGAVTTTIRSTETENTGAAQMSEELSITSRLQGFGGAYEIVGNFDRNSILIGVAWYDVERSYYRGIDRSFMHVDRFDMFNEFMQYTGDQAVYAEEYDAALSGYFGYKPAYEEFKEKYNIADAGFVTALPGFTFLNDADKIQFNSTNINADEVVSPDFIRSKPAEFDRFYVNLTGNSLANYFHFITVYYNNDDATRPMAYNPNIAL